MQENIDSKHLEFILNNRDKSIKELRAKTGLGKKKIRGILDNPDLGIPEPSFLLPERKTVAILLAVCLLFTLASYANAFSAPFHLDDQHVIVMNPAVKSLSLAPEYFALKDNVTVAAGGEYYRPVLFITYAVDYALGGTASTVPYHVTSTILHAGAAFMLAIIVFILASTKRAGLHKYRFVIAAGAGALFAAHPMLTEAVTYLSGRSEVLVTFFILAALAAALGADLTGKKRWRVLSVTAFWLALFSKEYAFLFLVFYPLVRHVFIGEQLPENRRTFLSYVPYAVIFVIFAVIYAVYTSQARHMQESPPALEYLASQPKAVATYLYRMVLPLPSLLTFDYDAKLYTNAPDIVKLLTAALVAVIIITAVSLRRRFPLAAFGIFFIFIALAPTSSIFPIKDPIFERRAYLALAGFVIALAVALVRISELIKWNELKTKRLVCSILAVLALLYVSGSLVRNGAYASTYAINMDTIKKSPAKARAYYNLGNYFYNTEGKYVEALSWFLKAIELEPMHERHYYAAGNAYIKLKNYEKAGEYLEKSLEVYPHPDVRNGRKIKLYTEGQYSLGQLYLTMGRDKADENDYRAAADLFEKAARKFDDTIWIYETHVSIKGQPQYHGAYLGRIDAWGRLWYALDKLGEKQKAMRVLYLARRAWGNRPWPPVVGPDKQPMWEFNDHLPKLPLPPEK